MNAYFYIFAHTRLFKRRHLFTRSCILGDSQSKVLVIWTGDRTWRLTDRVQWPWLTDRHQFDNFHRNQVQQISIIRQTLSTQRRLWRQITSSSGLARMRTSQQTSPVWSQYPVLVTTHEQTTHQQTSPVRSQYPVLVTTHEYWKHFNVEWLITTRSSLLSGYNKKPAVSCHLSLESNPAPPDLQSSS
jgi:hypothetical protein